MATASEQAMVWVETPMCTICSRTAVVELTVDEALAVNSGMFIQDALPQRDAATRELFVSGTHEHCWLGLFGEEED